MLFCEQKKKEIIKNIANTDLKRFSLFETFNFKEKSGKN